MLCFFQVSFRLRSSSSKLIKHNVEHNIALQHWTKSTCVGCMSFKSVELADMDESPWGGVSKKRNNGMQVGLLDSTTSSSSFAPPSDSGALRERLSSRPRIAIDPKAVCCTVFSIISATMLLLLGIYGAADGEGKYLILVEGGGKENGGSRGTQVGHIIGAAVIYTLFAVGCGFRWWKQYNGEEISYGFGRRQSVLNPSFE